MTPNSWNMPPGQTYIAVVGGKLQGVEVVYLARKAGIRTLVIDRHPEAPAAGLCDLFLTFEFTPDNGFPDCPVPIDLIFPALEDEAVLERLAQWSEHSRIPLAFDLSAYRISSSKKRSNLLFDTLHLPIPKPWPGCPFPVAVKPDNASGSQGVEICHTPQALESCLSRPRYAANAVVQQFVEGPSFSIEVLGCQGRYHPLQITDLSMDEVWDCCRVTAPSVLTTDQARRLKQMGVRIAEALDLNGLMDLEVILHDNRFFVLEIDARFPSQTPITVFWSSGLNMVELQVSATLEGSVDPLPASERPALFEHIQVREGKLSVAGEHIMGKAGPLKVIPDFFGADEAITSFRDQDASQESTQDTTWIATLIFGAETWEGLYAKQKDCHERIKAHARGLTGGGL